METEESPPRSWRMRWEMHSRRSTRVRGWGQEAGSVGDPPREMWARPGSGYCTGQGSGWATRAPKAK